MEGDIHSLSGRLGVVGLEIQERIKSRSRVRIQQRPPQPRLAYHADGQILPHVPGRTETSFPVPSLEIVAKFSHLALKTKVKERVPVGELFVSRTDVVNAAKRNPGSYGETASIGKEIWDRRICDSEGIKRILDW